MDFFKYEDEIFVIEADLSDRTSETPSASTVTAFNKDGDNVSTIILDQSTKTNGVSSIQIQVRAGTAGTKYKIIFEATISSGQKLIDKVLCEVKEL